MFNSISVEEVAAAAAKAQQFIDEHNLSMTLLTLDTAEPGDEPVTDFYRAGAPLDSRKQARRWRIKLASVIARTNGCRIYLHDGAIALVGRASDAETVRYLYTDFTREVERLANAQKGMDRTWQNYYRLKIVDAISARIRIQHRQFESAVRVAARDESSVALVRVDRALAKMNERVESVSLWMKQHHQ